MRHRSVVSLVLVVSLWLWTHDAEFRYEEYVRLANVDYVWSTYCTHRLIVILMLSSQWKAVIATASTHCFGAHTVRLYCRLANSFFGAVHRSSLSTTEEGK